MTIGRLLRQSKSLGYSLWASASQPSANSRIIKFIKLRKSAAATLLAIIAAIVGTWGWQAVAGSDQSASNDQPASQTTSTSTSTDSTTNGGNSTSAENNGGSASASVNGQTYTQSGPGSIHKVVSGNNSQTTIDINVSNGGSHSQSTYSTSGSSVQVDSSSTSFSSSSSHSTQMGGQ